MYNQENPTCTLHRAAMSFHHFPSQGAQIFFWGFGERYQTQVVGAEITLDLFYFVLNNYFIVIYY